ncbi:MAG TPA: helix-turn-helix domain-containing protein [Gaiellaceae bacterium]|nr:helix-turn-helix domain-containing protein [Gaiellaceae bacterium]
MDESGTRTYDAPDTMLVSDPAQLRAIADEVRGRILALLRERAASVTELAEALEMPKGTLAHHVKVLESAGLIHVVATRQVRAVTEKFYGRTARLFMIEHDGEDPSLLHDIAVVTLRTAAAEILRGGGIVTHGLVRVRLSDADARRFDRRLKKLVDDVRRAEDRSGRTYGLAVAMYREEKHDA